MKRKGTIRGFISGAVTMALLFTMIGTVLAAARSQQISATFNSIKLVVDGKAITPKDATGNVVEPFIYNGTTYLPVRAVGDAVGKSVYWDGKTSTVYLGVVDGATPVEKLTNLPVFQGDTLEMKASGFTDNTGTLHQPAVYTDAEHSTYLLNMKYSRLKGNVALEEDYKNISGKVYFNIYGDDKLIYTSSAITSGTLPQDFDVDISGVVKLKLEITDCSSYFRIILSGLDLYN